MVPEDTKIAVILTQYKRNHLERQLNAIKNNNRQPDMLVVFQNGDYYPGGDIKIKELKNKYNFFHVKSEYNTKYFGRFAYCLTLPVDICIVMDDDIIPGMDFIEHYVSECLRCNAIMGGNGRYGYESPYNPSRMGRNYKPGSHEYNSLLSVVKDTGIREHIIVDFVGHCWCFKKEWLTYSFSKIPFTYETSEDMHFCFTSKILGDINSYQTGHKTINECSDITNNALADDNFSSFKTTDSNLRINTEKYWVENGFKYTNTNYDNTCINGK